MKILITGSNGLLGQKLIYLLKNRTDINLTATSKGGNRCAEVNGYAYYPLDITDNTAVFRLLDEIKPNCIINTAAMTNVDECEKSRDLCKKLNVDAVVSLKDWVGKNGNCQLIHISTDFVFDGEHGPYKEDDATNPLSYYASSKVESEQVLVNSKIPWTILRTIIIYGVVDDAQRSNVVLWTKSSLENKKKINVITDQYRSPTLAEDLAKACELAALKKATGIYHISGKEVMSIIDLVYYVADYFKLDKSYIHPVTSAELNQPAKRPPRTGFILDKAIHELGYHPHSLKEGLDLISSQLAAKKR